MLCLCHHAWPSSTSDSELQPYFNCRDKLSVINGSVLWGLCVVVPPAGRDGVLEQLHDTHPGISKMKALACSYVWWPGLDKAIESNVQQCEVCQTNCPLPTKAPLYPWEWPTRPWARVHLDHAGPFHGKLFLIVVD